MDLQLVCMGLIFMVIFTFAHCKYTFSMPSFWNFFKQKITSLILTYLQVYMPASSLSRRVMEWTGQSLLWFYSPTNILRQHKNVGVVSGGRRDDIFLQRGELLHGTGFWGHRSAVAFCSTTISWECECFLYLYK